MSNYYLMNKDDIILEFEIKNEILGRSIREVKSFSKQRPIGFVDITTWIENRNYAKHKSHFSKWIKEWGIDTVEGFIDITHALGINDTLWIKHVDSNLDWNNINLYNNQFTDVAQKTAFESGLFGLQLSSTDIRSPEFTSEGSCPKCWINEDGRIYLLKAGLSGAINLGKEPYSEFIASQISKNIFPEQTIKYDLVNFKDVLCTKCELFTNEQFGYVPFYKFIDSNKSYSLNDVLSICSDMGYELDCKRMLLIDSIVFNQDRHLGNFGFIVNNETFEIVKFAPLFDFNQSMLCNALDSDLTNFNKYENDYLIGHKLGGEFANIGRAILTPELSTLLPKTLSFPIHEQYNMDNERLQLISDITERHIRSITGRDYFRVFIPGNTNYSNIKYSMLNEVENSGDLGCEDITQNKANGYDI